MPIIINADDFGIDALTNRAIAQAFAESLITHASLLVNLPCFREACDLARRCGVHDRIGLHLNFTEGAPLTDRMRRSPEFCADGHFLPPHYLRRYLPLPADAREAVAEETRAQIAAARAQGIPLSHLDSHNDVHTIPSIGSILVPIARSEGITRIRLSRNCGPRQGILRRMQQKVYNSWMGLNGNPVHRFGTIDDMLWLARKGRLGPHVAVEIMTHPRLGEAGAILDAPSMQPLAERLRLLQPYLSPPDLRANSV
jgi:predicted glycoside hydrolase/deacetylase ChbG (UPF0249 family)